ncbi:lysergyl peptide synthetase subunit 1 [Xylaria nigripes]|nr:lysergyl peptide synthetase subunit 1 [Xylaria nigripes]
MSEHIPSKAVSPVEALRTAPGISCQPGQSKERPLVEEPGMHDSMLPSASGSVPGSQISDWVQNGSNSSESLTSQHQSFEPSRPPFQAVEPCIFKRLRHGVPPTKSTFRSVEVQLDRIRTKLDDFCQNTNIAHTAVFKLAWGLLLRTYTGSNDVCFGYRTHEDIHDGGDGTVLGSSVHSFLCDLQFEQDMTKLDAAHKAESEWTQGLSSKHVSLVGSHHDVGEENDALFNTSIVFWPKKTYPSGSSPEASDPTRDPEEDIVVNVYSDWRCSVTYRNSLLLEEQAEHLIAALKVAFTSIIESPHQAIGHVELFSDLDQQKLSQWNVVTPTASEFCLHDLIGARCCSQPDVTAVFSWDGTITYQELDRLSSILADRLNRSGVKPKTFVLLCFDRCKWVPIAMLGSIKAGGAICALDPSYPIDRMKGISQLLGSGIILTTKGKASLASQLASTVIVLDDDELWIDTGYGKQERSLPLPEIRPNNALFSIFTSGSLGTPKGMVHEHRSYASYVLGAAKPLGIRPQDRILHYSSYAFDFSIFEILAALTLGASVAIPSEEARMKELPRAATDLQATWAFLTPTVARMYRPEDFPSLQTLSLGGEAIQVYDVDLWASKNLITGYNPAECCPIGISGPADKSAPNLLGWCLPSQAAWIVDPQDINKLAPVGAVGELLIEGPSVSRGYIHDPDSSLPGSPFITSPPKWLSRFRDISSRDTRLYRTGDLVQYGTNGAIHFIGRKDLQIKLHGQRMELPEIEYHLYKALTPFAKEIVVEAVNVADNIALVAFVVSAKHLESEIEVDVARPPELELITSEFELQIANAVSILRDTLPRYMIPTIYQPISHIPVSRSGKTDRRQLRSLALPLPRGTVCGIGGQPTEGQELVTEDEHLLQRLFSRVLRVSLNEITANSNFFSLGGDSVQAMKLLAAASQEGLGGLTYQDIFNHPTVRDMASVSGSSNHTSSPNESRVEPFFLIQDAESLVKIASAQCGVDTGDIEDIYPCTALQASLLAATVIDPETYIATQSFTLKDDIDSFQLKKAWTVAADTHPIFRTRIIQTGTGNFYQTVVKGSFSFQEDANGQNCESQFKPHMGLGTPLIQFSFTKSRLLVDMHHALYDGWSLSLLLNEVDRAFRQLPMQPRPFFNLFVKYVEETLSSSLSFWMAELRDVAPVHFPALPHLNYKPQPLSKTTRLITLNAPVDTGPNVTVATKLQLAWAITSSSYTNSPDVVFGLLTSGRNIPVAGVGEILGPTIASKPLRVLIDRAQEVTESLEELHYRSIEQTEYDHVGLQRIAQLGQSAAAACGFQTLLVIEPGDADRIQGSWFEQHNFLSDLTRFSSHSLMLRCLLLRDSVEVTATFDPHVVPEPQMKRILSQFQSILMQIHAVDSSDTTIRDLKLISSEDWIDLQLWNAKLPPTVDVCLHQLVQEKCQQQPQAQAIHSWDGNLTYKELDEYTRKLSRHLCAIGVGPNNFVAICVERSWWTVVVQLAVVTVGAAFITLETSQPLQRLQEICQTVQPVAVVTSDKMQLIGAHLGLWGPLVVVNQHLIDAHANSPSPPLERQTDNTSYAMYGIATSGTTGKPKLVVIEHRAFLANMRPLIDRWGFTEKSRVLQFASYSFDAMIVEHFITLLAGGCVCIPSSHDRDNSLVKSMNEMHVNWAMLTASTLQLLTPAAVPTLQTLVQAGEPMNQGIINRWASHLRLFNGYGPTECSVISSTGDAIPLDAQSPKNIGLATGGVFWIVNPEDTEESPLVPIGAEGELVIEGPILARGYLRDPEQTAAAFAPRPRWLQAFRQGDGENRIYRTGDIVRYESDGSVSYLRRKNSQLKLRGQRLELVEVEHHVQSCFPDALQVVADVIEHPNTSSSSLIAVVLTTYTCSPNVSIQGGKEAVGYGPLLMAKSPQFHTDTLSVELALQDRIPSYMVPSLFIPITRIPYDVSSGKVNREKIRNFLSSLSAEEWKGCISTDTISPASPLAQKLRDIWAHVLNIEPILISMRDSFFRLGGDSITSMQVSAQCQAAGIPITVNDMFRKRTIENLTAELGPRDSPQPCEPVIANGVETEQSLYSAGQLEELKARLQVQLAPSQTIEDIYPCSPAQRGILMSLARNPDYYDEAVQWKVVSTDPVDIGRLCEAWRQVVDRHEVLRTVFPDIQEQSYSDQVILRHFSPVILVCDNGEDAESPLPTKYLQPMHHLKIKRSRSGEVTVKLHIHHAYVDGHSVFIIKRDLALAYEQQLALSRPPSTYRAYIEHLRQHHSQKESNEFWRSYTENIVPCLFPSLKAVDTENTSEPFGLVTIEVGRTASLTQFCENHRLAVSSVFHVAWAIVIQSYTAMNDACFGYMTSSRHLPIAGIKDIVGPMFNILLARVNLPVDEPMISIMQQYQEGFLASLNYQHQSLADTLHIIGSASGKLFNTMISIFNSIGNGEIVQESSRISLLGDDVHSRSEYPITLNILMLADKVHMQLSYHTSLLSGEFASAIANIFCTVLATLLRQPQLRLKDLEVLSGEQRSGIFERNKNIPTAIDTCVHHTIHQQCLASPDCTAVCAWDGDFLYGQLDKLSSCLAKQLIDQGIGTGMTIPILIEKSRWTPVAMLAVLKSGAAFALMDASESLARLRTIYEVAKATVILASRQTRSEALEISSQVIIVTEYASEETQNGWSDLWSSVAVTGNNAAYMVFTSGSTGEPKGIVVNHSSLATAAGYLHSRMYVDSSSRVLQFASHAWDIPVTDVLLPLRVGGCVCIPSEEERKNSIVQAANRMMANWAFLTPTVARMLKPEDLTHMKTLVLGGEALSTADIAMWHKRVRLIQGYGPAECSLISAVTEPLDLSSNPRNIGQPNACAAWVVHPNNHDVLAPPGAVGELVLEGPIVSSGYANNSEQSAASFITPPPWLVKFRGGNISHRLYKTGDLVRSNLSGDLIFIGRRDDQVKIRGQRVELGEIEAKVSPAFPKSHVISELIKSSGSSSSVLVALILPKELADVPQRNASSVFQPSSSSFRETVSEAVSQLRNTMPLYMIPTVFLPLAYLPRTVSGKVNRKLLRDYVVSLSRAELEAYSVDDTSRRIPVTPWEARVQELVGRALRRPSDSIPLDEDLFAFGLDSLTAMTLATLARSEGLVIPVSTILRHPRLSELAVILNGQQERVQEQSPTTQPNPLMASAHEICAKWHLDLDQVASILPTTYFQRTCIASYHACFIALHFRRSLDPDEIRDAVISLVNKYAILRTAFVPFKETFVQLCLHDFDLPVQEIVAEEDDPSLVAESICQEADRAPVDFGIPTTQLILIRGRAGGRLTATLRVHRAQLDGVTMSTFITDLRSTFDDKIVSPSPVLEYADFITRRAEYNSSSVFQVWQELLEGSSMTYLKPPGDMIQDGTGPSTEPPVTSSCDIPMPDIKGAFTMATVIKAAWALCLREQTQTQDVVFAQLVRNRHLPVSGIEQTAGPCINFVPVRVSLKPDWTALDLLHYIHSQQIRTMASDTVDWDDLVTTSTTWPRDTRFGSVVHYLSAPVAGDYVFAENIPCQFRMYDFKMMHTCAAVTCLPFPSAEDSSVTVLKIILTSAEFGQELSDRLLSVLCSMIMQLTTQPNALVMELTEHSHESGKVTC